MSVRLLRRLTDTALRAAFRSLPSPQATLPSPARFYRGRVKDTRYSRPQSKRCVYSLFGLSIEIVCKIHLNRPTITKRLYTYAGGDAVMARMTSIDKEKRPSPFSLIRDSLLK